mgnify:CR=1 FL=1
MTQALHRKAYEMLTSEDDGRVCKDIPDEACREQPGNFLTHVLSLAATKSGDGLADPKLVLSWLLGALGAPSWLVGLLVPVREAGALLPQLVTAGYLRSLPRRKWAWAAGSAVQGLAVAGMGFTALTLTGATAGIAIVGLLGVFALARSVCSVSYKDVLGKTVSKATRGTATGTAGTIASVTVLIFGILLSTGVVDKTVTAIAFVLFVAAGLWIAAAGLFSTLAEAPGATEGGSNPLKTAIAYFSNLSADRQLRLFIATRALLVPTALAPPYLLAIAGREGNGLGDLGPFVMASALAAVVSSYVWGRLSDISSRRVLILSACVGAGVLGTVSIAGLADANWLERAFILPAALFVLMIAYQGRSTHLVDMADEDRRAGYTALSNTIIGVVLVAGGAFGWISELYSTQAVLGIFAIMCLGAAGCAALLREVQQTGGT